MPDPGRPEAAGSVSGAGPGIRLGDRVHHARKRFFLGTHRTATPEETLERIRPHLLACGITRLADVTGLDRIGIHTVLGHRPNSPTLSNSAGKGFSLAAATVSAAMEGIELFHAETVGLPPVECAWNDLPADGHIPVERLAGTRHGAFRTDLAEHWVWGWDLIGGRPAAAPWTAVAMLGPPGGRGLRNLFAMGTNGLASGNHILEAVAAALYEVIERDAVACWRYAGNRHGILTPRVALETVDSPAVQDLVRRFAAAGIVPLLYDVTADTGVPTYMAIVYDKDFRHGGMYRGYGTHLEPAVAMCRALTEAVQSRLVLIAGSRDDHFRRDVLRNQGADTPAQVAGLEAAPATVHGRAHPDRSTPTFEGDIAVLLGCLRRVGIEQAIAFDLTKPEMGIPVARVVVPGLEGYNFDFYTPGARPVAFAEALRAGAA
ncbi:YcaO-like family protein [Azospirillum thermophilum]|uniref:YcaO domain-containing protein n=1 Tax=Azospirillum thermophilum TaxID=2202148 RepID=A0A2S2CPG8_9PROT|nr:YcaO-like family protein [Azospirillum thermophilum]AWK86382.1 hypothetical protein DEW08_09130 [Azospirillum thermophilum]